MSIITEHGCPAASRCDHPTVCDDRGLCTRMHARPVDLMDNPSLVHFVGFRGEEYHNAVRAFGFPDFVHKTWDRRALQEITPSDTVVFAKYHDMPPTRFSFDDSNQPEDPAAAER